jgi:hypothetical protein
VTNIDCHRLKAPTCYVEVTSFKFIRSSAFCPEWGREACRETTDTLVGRGKCPPPGAVGRNGQGIGLVWSIRFEGDEEKS